MKKHVALFALAAALSVPVTSYAKSFEPGIGHKMVVNYLVNPQASAFAEQSAPRVMDSQRALNCRDQANVARVLAAELQTGKTFSQAYHRVDGMPFHRNGIMTIRSFVQMYYQANEPLYPYAKTHTPDQVWHNAFVACMPTHTWQEVKLPDGTYSTTTTPISPAERKLINEQTYIPGLK